VQGHNHPCCDWTRRPQWRENARDAGADGYLSKPINKKLLLR
ncbi:MAG: CheY-like chemotaxis protein, partial [Planctomycetota bacterium]